MNVTAIQCPYCAEDIKPGAIKCKHCGSSLESAPERAIKGAVSGKAYEALPWFRRNLPFVLLYLFLWPVALGIMWSGDVYYRRKGRVMTYGLPSKIVLSLLAVGWGIRALAGMVSQ